MKILYFCPIWGMVPDYVEKLDGDLPKILEKIKLAGYDGVEMAVPFDDNQKHQLRSLLNDFELELVALQYAANGNNLEEYIKSYARHITSIMDVKPLLINSHTGKDYYSTHDNHMIINEAIILGIKQNVKILHETHRGRFSFHSATTQQYLQQHKDLRLVADFSHWCNVSESLLEEQQANVANAMQRSDHIHARVGYNQGCQVNDPRAPEWNEALQAHLNWWDEIIKIKKNAGEALFTITPEFGPAPYMPVTPYKQLPLANQWEINHWMKDFLKNRYA